MSSNCQRAVLYNVHVLWGDVSRYSNTDSALPKCSYSQLEQIKQYQHVLAQGYDTLSYLCTLYISTLWAWPGSADG